MISLSNRVIIKIILWCHLSLSNNFVLMWENFRFSLQILFDLGYFLFFVRAKLIRADNFHFLLGQI